MKNPAMTPGHQMQRMTGVQKLQANLRNSVFVLDPFAIKNVDAILSTHDHNDHIDVNVAAAVLKNCPATVPFIGPEACVKLWTSWGRSGGSLRHGQTGDVIKVRDVEIVVLESFDRTAQITAPVGVTLKGQMPMDMDKMAVNYLFKTPGGSLYHSGDSHYSNHYAKHGNEHDIDVALAPTRESPRNHRQDDERGHS